MNQDERKAAFELVEREIRKTMHCRCLSITDSGAVEIFVMAGDGSYSKSFPTLIEAVDATRALRNAGGY